MSHKTIIKKHKMNSNITILVVDDEEDILEFVGYNLRNEGYNVITSNNGLGAIEMARNSCS